MNAQLHIQTTYREGITIPSKTYFTPPFKVANITEDKQSPWLQLMLMSSSPGILDGDQYELKIELKENSRLRLHTQSYQRLFNMKQGAKQSMEVQLGPNAAFTWLPHPAVPHENSLFSAKNKIVLSAGSELIWGEILTCGRKLNGEVFRLGRYHSDTEIFLYNKLIIKENLLVQPSLIDPTGIGQLEGYTHQASLVYVSEKGLSPGTLDILQNYFSQQTGITFGITATAGNGWLIRILGYKAEQLYDYMQTIVTCYQSKQLQSNPIAHVS
jgi:urease accessory protein